MQTNKHIRRWMLQAAVAAVLSGLGTAAATAQVRDNGDGRALDANNQVGSNGYNNVPGSDGRNRSFYTSQQIITGNVTRGLSFRGVVPYTDSRAFRGPTVGNFSDRFVRDSSGVADGQVTGLEAPTAFYARSRVVPPPTGFEREGFTGGYINRSGNAFETNSFSARGSYDSYAVDDPFSARSRERLLATPAPGANDAQQANQAVLITASPLYGVRQWNNTERSTQDFFNPRGPTDSIERAGFGLDPTTVERMRNEVNQNGIPADQRTDQPGQENGGLSPTGEAAQPLNTPLNATPGDPTGANPGGDAGQGAQPLGANIDPGNGVRSRLVVPANQQSQLYRELVRRYDRQQQNQPVSPQESARQFNTLRRAQQAETPGQADQNTTAGGQAPGAQQPGGAPAVSMLPGISMPPAPVPGELPPRRSTDRPEAPPRPRVPVPADAPPAPTEAPTALKITSLAQGIPAAGLRDLMTTAEQLLKDGKYDSAIEKYDAAAMVAVENPLITLGRAQAELGATYYRRAENDLRRAIEREPALLKGEYDLRTFLGQERLQYVVQDLKALADREPTDARSMLLLAYIAYNTGMAEQAAAFLNEAAKRAGGNDRTVDLMRQVWTLPAGEPAPGAPPPPAADAPTELNK